MADAGDLKSPEVKPSCGFDSHPAHLEHEKAESKTGSWPVFLFPKFTKIILTATPLPNKWKASPKNSPI
jgi:hypothetical protein